MGAPRLPPTRTRRVTGLGPAAGSRGRAPAGARSVSPRSAGRSVPRPPKTAGELYRQNSAGRRSLHNAGPHLVICRANVLAAGAGLGRRPGRLRVTGARCVGPGLGGAPMRAAAKLSDFTARGSYTSRACRRSRPVRRAPLAARSSHCSAERLSDFLAPRARLPDRRRCVGVVSPRRRCCASGSGARGAWDSSAAPNSRAPGAARGPLTGSDGASGV